MRRFQFSLKFLLIAVTGISVWLGVYVERARRQQDAVGALHELGSGVLIEYDYEDAGRKLGQNPPKQPAGGKLLGIDMVANVSSLMVMGWQLPRDSQFSDAEAERLGAFPKLEHLRLDGTNVTDSGLACLASLRHLKSLYLRRLPLTDAGLANLRQLPKLTALIVDCDAITVAGYKHLAELPSLRFLDLRSTPLTDAGLLRLASSLSLREILVSGRQLTPRGVEAFRRLTPKCKLSFKQPLAAPAGIPPAASIPWVVVAKDKKTFALAPSGGTFTPWGFNYDRDAEGRLIEDYWEAEWATVEADFAEMKKLGANVVRIHLQLGKFLDGPQTPNRNALDRLAKLLRLAEKERLYLDLTGLGCYHKKDVPDWYDKLAENERWDVQARFWQAVAGQCAESPAVFCYDIMNEPVVPGGKRADGDWLAPPFAGKHFVQFITLDQQERPRADIARQWIRRLTAAIREKDSRHLITVGLVDWSLDRPGLTSGFVPAKVADDLDFIAVHLYPKSGKLSEALDTLAGFAVGKPVVIEETFPLACSPGELEEFIDASRKRAAGLIGFYWGQTPDELSRSNALSDAVTFQWLQLFEKKALARTK